MSGHSKWSSIKHKKAAVDSKRGKIFTKIIREITVAAKSGGGDIDSNPTLRLAISKAKEANMPADNITRAIKKGTGELEGVNYEEQLYEGYGPGKIGILIQILTDNKNRTAAEIRAIFSKRNGNMASPGAVSYLFAKKGYIEIEESQIKEDDLFLLVTEAGAEDLKNENGVYEVITGLESFHEVKKALDNAGVKCVKAELAQIPETSIAITDADTAQKLQGLIEALEDNDDVQAVYDNSDISDEIISQLTE
ncbi:MAG: hypothetical protein ACD_79C00367G0005 [uncultured bacterium]|nr:MAG: hypothetical protein ACD_79C00367G0005 [uncultured bacterium]